MVSNHEESGESGGRDGGGGMVRPSFGRIMKSRRPRSFLSLLPSSPYLHFLSTNLNVAMP